MENESRAGSNLTTGLTFIVRPWCADDAKDNEK
jgi:hypothetical protein